MSLNSATPWTFFGITCITFGIFFRCTFNLFGTMQSFLLKMLEYHHFSTFFFVFQLTRNILKQMFSLVYLRLWWFFFTSVTQRYKTAKKSRKKHQNTISDSTYSIHDERIRIASAFETIYGQFWFQLKLQQIRNGVHHIFWKFIEMTK